MQQGDGRVLTRAKGRRTGALLAALVLAVTVGTVGSGTATAANPGVTDETVTISVSGAYSGPLAAISNRNFNLGFEIWRKEINSKGGINGRRVFLRKVDNLNTPDGNVSACKEIANNNTFAVMIEQTAGSDECYDKAGIPALNLNPRFFGKWKNVYFVGNIPSSADVEVSFLTSKYMKANTQKLGIIVSQDSIGLMNQYKAVTAELKKQKMKVLRAEKILTGQASFVPQLERLKAAGAQTVLMFVGLESAGIMRDARALNFKPQWYAGPATAIDLVAQASRGLMRGVRATRYIAPADSPAFAQYKAKVSKFAGSTAAGNADTLSAQAYVLGSIMGEMLRVGGKNLTRPSFVANAATIQNYSPAGLMAPFTLKGRADHVGVTGMYPLTCCTETNTYRGLGSAANKF